MTILPLTWPDAPDEAIEDQIRARAKLVTQSLELKGLLTCVAVGVSYNERRKVAVATGVQMFMSGKSISTDPPFMAERSSYFPYVPGLFVYREGPAVAALLNNLPGKFDLLVTFGQGIAHPRGFGLAAHIGVLASVPSIGITRKRLWGFGPTPDLENTRPAMLRDKKGNTIGIVRRLLPGCDPIYASPGHLTDIATTMAFLDRISAVRGCLPEGLSIAQDEANAQGYGR